jgi:hypothetical protein
MTMLEFVSGSAIEIEELIPTDDTTKLAADGADVL